MLRSPTLGSSRNMILRETFFSEEDLVGDRWTTMR